MKVEQAKWSRPKALRSFASGQRGPALLFLALVSLQITPSRAAPLVVQAPCSDSSSEGLRPCSQVLSATTSEFGPGTLPLVRGRIQDLVNGRNLQATQLQDRRPGLYQNVVPGGPGVPAGYFGPTVCNPVAGPLNGNQAEGLDSRNTNHHGRFCGLPTEFRIQIVDEGWLLPDIVTYVSVNRRWNASNPERSPGTLEDAFIRGALIQSMNCHLNGVLADVETRRSIIVDSEGPCAALAADLIQQNTGLSGGIQSLRQKLATEQANLKDIVACKVSDFGGTSASDGRSPAQALSEEARPDLGPLRQSAQHLCSARLNIESMFNQLVACEVVTRARNSYYNQLGTSEAQIRLLEAFRNSISQQVASTCRSRLETAHDRRNLDVPSARANELATECATNEYQRLLGPWIQREIQSRWPTEGQSCRANSGSNRTASTIPNSSGPNPSSPNPAGLLGIFGALSLTFTRGRRKIRKGSGERTFAQLQETEPAVGIMPRGVLPRTGLLKCAPSQATPNNAKEKIPLVQDSQKNGARRPSFQWLTFSLSTIKGASLGRRTERVLAIAMLLTLGSFVGGCAVGDWVPPPGPADNPFTPSGECTHTIEVNDGNRCPSGGEVGTGFVAESLAAAAASSARAENAFRASRSLEGEDGAMDPRRQKLAQGQAATADSGQVGEQLLRKTASDPEASRSSGGPGARSLRNSGGGGAPGGTDSSGSFGNSDSLGSLKTESVNGGGKAGADADAKDSSSQNLAAASSAYSAGAGTGASAASGNGSSGAWSYGSEGALEGAAAQLVDRLNMGREPASAADGDGQARSSPDPEDYFTRLGLDSSLFKVVESRYRSTTARWPVSTLR